mgnify:CR=1 FL=1
MTRVITRAHAQWVHDMAKARRGLPYAYGGAFSHNPRHSTDCSGLVLQTAAWYMGRKDWAGNRYGSTESFRLDHKIVYDLGFKRMPRGGPAALPIKPVMLVGIQHGGGGIYSHTACTLMTMDHPDGPVKMSARGVDWESRGGNPGVFLYDGARAWNDPLFHDFWYLDAVLEGEGNTDDMANVPQDQWNWVLKAVSELHGAMFNQISSQSGYADPGGRTWQLHELIKNMDGMGHVRYVEDAAKKGDLREIARVVRSARGLGIDRSPEFIARARRVLADIERDNPEYLQEYIARNGAL